MTGGHRTFYSFLFTTITIKEVLKYVPDLLYPSLHQTQCRLASKSIATTGTAPVAVCREQESETTIFEKQPLTHPLPEHLILLPAFVFLPQNVTSLRANTTPQATGGFLEMLS